MKKPKNRSIINLLSLCIVLIVSTLKSNAAFQLNDEKYSLTVGYGIDTTQILHKRIIKFVESYIQEFADCHSPAELDVYWQKPKIVKDSLFDQGLDFLTRGSIFSRNNFMQYHDAILLNINPIKDSLYKASVAFLLKDQVGNSNRGKIRAVYEYNVKINRDGFKFINNIDLFMESAFKTTYKDATYYYMDKSHYLKSDAKRTASLIRSFSTYFPDITIPKFDYIICKDIAEVGLCLNLRYSYVATSTGIASNQNSFLLSAKGNAYYPHETIHVIAPTYIPGFLWEGFATYFGGSDTLQYTEFIKSDNRLSVEVITECVQNETFSWYYNYVFGALLCDYIFNSLKIDNYEVFFNSFTSFEECIDVLDKEYGVTKDQLTKDLISHYQNHKS